MELTKIKHVHLVGIKGVGMTGLAVIFAEMGKTISGSDIAESFITQKALNGKNIYPLIGFDPENVKMVLKEKNLKRDELLVIMTSAHNGYDNPEVKTAEKLGIPVLSHAQALGLLMKEKKTKISIAGTHGKTTTSAMIAHILIRAGLDPAYAVGTGSIKSVGLPAHWGKGEFFIAEADEYVNDPKTDKRSRFLWQEPEILVLTNLEYDHPDVFPDIESLKQAFSELSRRVPENGRIIACSDSPELKALLKGIEKRIIWYGFSSQAEYQITDYKTFNSEGFFVLSHKNKQIGEQRVKLSGSHNAANATAAMLAAVEIGLNWQTVCQKISDYSGSERRFDFMGEIGETLFYDDYAHHPTEIKMTLKMVREIYPDRKIIGVFQPHTFSRTKALLDGFATAFGEIDQVIITDIFASAREKNDPQINSEKLVQKIKQHRSGVIYCPKLSDVIEYLKPSIGQEQIVLTMGAGDVYKVIDCMK